MNLQNEVCMNTNFKINYVFAVAVSAILLIIFSAVIVGNKLNSLKSKAFLLSEQVEYNKNLVKQHEDKIEALQSIINEISNVTVKATSYNAVSSQTDSTPNETSCGVVPRVGSIAVSQDLFYKGWTCGKWVRIKRFGIFEITQVLDVMHYRKTSQIDIVKATEEEANEFGVVTGLNAVLLTNYEKM